jgi:hypothetical protein
VDSLANIVSQRTVQRQDMYPVSSPRVAEYVVLLVSYFFSFQQGPIPESRQFKILDDTPAERAFYPFEPLESMK